MDFFRLLLVPFMVTEGFLAEQTPSLRGDKWFAHLQEG